MVSGKNVTGDNTNRLVNRVSSVSGFNLIFSKVKSVSQIRFVILPFTMIQSTVLQLDKKVTVAFKYSQRYAWEPQIITKN